MAFIGGDTSFVKTDYELEQRSFDKEKWRTLSSDDAFLYDRPPPEPSWFDEMWFWLLKHAGVPALEGINNILYYSRYLIIGLVILFVIRHLLQANFSSLFFKKTKRKSINNTLFNENIHELNFEQLIKEAVAKEEYRRAVRLHYLKSLKLLNNKDLIDWKINKTNQEYLHELQKTSLKKGFDQLTYWFDYIWYGEFPVSQATFEQVQQNFNTFNQQIQRR